MARKTLPDPSEVRRAFAYDPDTGVVTWLVNPGKCRLKGKVAGTCIEDGRRRLLMNYRAVRATWVIWCLMTGDWPPKGMVIDHKDGNPANDRWENLRLATRAENSGNDRKRKTNTSGFKGVSRYKNGKWMAQIMWQRQTYWLGLHDTPEQAHTAYCQAAAKLKGEFARFG